jgi:anti-sigma28 factor (negative regulator of flagellin synthesis)
MSKSNASRDAKLAEIKQRLDEGNYEVKTEDLANKILGE